MRWGFNAGVLLEEALDRAKLFVESQTVNEAAFFDREQPLRTLALRGINHPGKGVQMSLVGKITATSQVQAEQAGTAYARELYSIFPHDFILQPANTSSEYRSIAGLDFLERTPHIAAIQRGRILIPPLHPHQQLQGLWHASARSNEQIWRALSNMPRTAMLHVLLQPAFLFENERKRLLELKDGLLNPKENVPNFLPYRPWMERYLNRRLDPWKKFFLLQVHVLVDGPADDSLLRAIGSAITRDTPDLSLPGYEIIRPDSNADEQAWVKNIHSLAMPYTRRMDDLADLDEAFSVFRFPLRHEAGLPGANFIDPPSVG